MRKTPATPDGLCTIKDIVSEVPVTTRTIRSWVNKGLIPRPVRIGLGRAGGSAAYYPQRALDAARAIYEIRQAARTPNLHPLVTIQVGESVLTWRMDDGGFQLIYSPPLFQEEED